MQITFEYLMKNLLKTNLNCVFFIPASLRYLVVLLTVSVCVFLLELFVFGVQITQFHTSVVGKTSL